MTKYTLFALTPVALLLLPGTVKTQARQHYSRESPAGLRLHHLTAEPATFRGVARQFGRMTSEEQRQSQLRLDDLALIENLDFSSGVIEAEIAGAPTPGAFGADAFYLRPTNGRAEDRAWRNRIGLTKVDATPRPKPQP